MGTLIAVLSLLLAIGSLIYTKVMNDRNKKEQAVLRNKANRLEADAMYEKVRVRRGEFEECLADYQWIEKTMNDSDEESPKIDAEKHEALVIKCMAKYAALYNEIEAFCARMLDGTINSESYVTDEVLPALKQDAVRQASLFGAFNKSARALDLSPIPKPDPASFKSYNAVIKQYYGKDKLWMNALDRIRHENSFKY
ncbi:hypothetical protein [Cohnella sp. GCM10027633]|uniref:hypothetical protein n=1 Tax=unclassified Cohnella TaxID=2636738 RepID=UPI003629A4F2